jgi:methionyl-tRNA formyltransferase
MDENLDSGDIVTMEKLEINKDIHCTELYDNISQKGSDILLQTLKNMTSGNYKLTPQDHNNASYAKKIEKSEFLLDFNYNAIEIYNKIRALNACGSAYFVLNNQRIKIHRAKLVNQVINDNKDQFIITKKDFIINCKDGAIRPLILQKSGKSKVDLKDFLNQMNF